MLTGICSRCRQPSTPGLNLAKCTHCDGPIAFEFKEDPDGIGFLVVLTITNLVMVGHLADIFVRHEFI